MNMLRRNFANIRGFVRTVLDQLKWFSGPYRRYGRVDWSNVRRLVFVCQGNICRSPFAKCLAEQRTTIPVSSFGLSTTTGAEADAVARNVATQFSIDLSSHRATNWKDFTVQPGDLLLVMEDRHIRQLAEKLDGQAVQICLLGLWCRPRFALLYDPFGQSRDYFEICFARIENAVGRLIGDSGRLSAGCSGPAELP